MAKIVFASGSLCPLGKIQRSHRIPVHLVTLTGGGPETFQEISLTHIANLEKFIGLRHDLKKVDQSGLSLARLFLRGAWSGFYKDPEDWQDVAILTIA